VATVVNATVVIFRNTSTTDDTAIMWATILVFVAAILALSQRYLRNDTAYGMVIAWALYGVGVKQQIYVQNGIMADAPQLTQVAQTTALAVAGILALWWLVSTVQNFRASRA
jgi:hypothetical protein